MKPIRLDRVLAAAAAASSLLAAAPAVAQAPPKSGAVPVDAAFEQRVLEQVKAAEGFKVTLFAGPPHAMYPTCLTAAADGAVFVCIDPNLSLDRAKGRGRITRLVDQDHDGRADRYTVFADSLDSPRGVVSDGNTLYVMAPPNLLALRDTDGDGTADEREVLVQGIGFDLDFRGADHTTNGITLGIDGWLYIAVGDYGFRKAIGRDGTQLQHRGGGVARVRTDGTELEMYAYNTRNIYDLAVDPFLNVFTRDNTNDGDGWNTRLHYLAPTADMGYPALYRNFADEHFPTLHDYGGGSGTAGLWVQDPGYPAGYNNTLYTGDWTVNKVFRHPLREKGASYEVEQEEFLSLPHPADMVMDSRSNMYVASLAGGSFTYRGDSIGYVIRVSYPGQAAQRQPQLGGSATEAQLLDVLVSANAEHRLNAQRELLRRRPSDATLRRLEQVILSAQQPAYARVAAIFTLKQLVGPRSHAVLLRAVEDPAVRELALRALADRKGETAGVPVARFVQALQDPSARVQLQAVNGLARLGAVEAADAILPLAAGSDPALAHVAVNALVQLNASQAALRALDTGSPAAQTAALRVLQRLHEPGTVTALTSRLGRARTPQARGALLGALARLYNREGIWAGDWWTTKPSFLGPYFDPAAWEGSALVRPVLRDALLAASGEEFTALADAYVRNRVLPQGAQPLLAALTASRDPQRAEVIDALIGRKDVDASVSPLLARLDAKNDALHSAVVQLLVAQSNLGSDLAPLVQRAALDAKLSGEVRSQVLASLTRVPGAAGMTAAAPTFAKLIPAEGGDEELERAWRRFVGDRRNQGAVDYYVGLTRSADEAERVLAYSVLVQIARAGGTPAPVKAKATAAIEAAWGNASVTPTLVRAITVMRAEGEYTDRLQSYTASRK